MRLIRLLLFLTLWSPSLPALSADPAQITDQLQQTYQQASNWRADFVQSTFVELLNRNIEKEGAIFIKKPGKLRIEYQEESGRHYISDGKTLWIYTPGDTQVEVYRKISKLLAKEALTFMEGLGNIERDFTVRSFSLAQAAEVMIENKTLSLIELIPKNPESIIKRIVMGVDRQKGFVFETTIFNKSGNVTHYNFLNVELNADLGDELFVFKKPKGVREIKGL